jgi:hypothetical protein
VGKSRGGSEEVKWVRGEVGRRRSGSEEGSNSLGRVEDREVRTALDREGTGEGCSDGAYNTHLHPNPSKPLGKARKGKERQGIWSHTFNLSASSACCLIHSMKRLGSARNCFFREAKSFLSFVRAASDQGSLPHTRSQNTNIRENRSSLGHWSSPRHV